MIKFTRLFLSIMAFLAMSAVIACSSNDEPKQDDMTESHYCKMRFTVTKTGFSDEFNTRSATQWENGDTIYLLFTSGENLVYGDAVYTDGEWYVNYDGSLVKDQETTCHAIYFENNISSTHSTITLNENSAIYEDLEGKYTLTDGSLSVTANLKPKTGRMRLKGVNHDEVKIYGISHYTSFNRYTGEFSSSKEIIKAKVVSEYTSYIYGEFTDTVEPRVNVWKSDQGFTRLFPSSIYKAGESGYITIPTNSSHNGWQNNVIFKVNNVEFTMIPVEYSSGNFLMAQTETTEALYEAIISDGKVSQLPKSNISYYEFQDFISVLNSEMALSFRFPSSDEWLFAAKGGNKTQNFTYSGSNDISQVAWYIDNSGNTVHDVATLQPNELGFYDMSGNVSEWSSSTPSEYPYLTKCYYGGAYNDISNSCEIKRYNSYSDDRSTSRGFRLCMSN